MNNYKINTHVSKKYNSAAYPELLCVPFQITTFPPRKGKPDFSSNHFLAVLSSFIIYIYIYIHLALLLNFT